MCVCVYGGGRECVCHYLFVLMEREFYTRDFHHSFPPLSAIQVLKSTSATNILLIFA